MVLIVNERELGSTGGYLVLLYIQKIEISKTMIIFCKYF